MRYFELLEHNTNVMSYSQILEKFPQIESDLISVGEWENADPKDLTYRLVIEPIDVIANSAKEMYDNYDEFPEDAKRTNKIIKLLRSGSQQLPVFIKDGDSDNFVMEGRHRMVAFYVMGLKTVPVVYIIN